MSVLPAACVSRLQNALRMKEREADETARELLTLKSGLAVKDRCGSLPNGPETKIRTMLPAEQETHIALETIQ